jgi:rhodanese-related sulfurtransferase
MKRLVALFAVLGLLVSCSSVAGVTNLNAEQFVAKSQEMNVVVVDVRTSGEFSEGHLANAINIDVEAGVFDQEIATLDKSATYAVYCRSGRRSGIATEKMAKAGFTSVFNLKQGGFTELAQLGVATA